MYSVRKNKRKASAFYRIQHEYQAAQKQYQALLDRNAQLRQREQFLLEAVHEQGDNLHYVALAAFQEQEPLLHACTCTQPKNGCTCGATIAASLTASVLEDLKVYELLQMVGGSAATGSATEPNTTQWMRAAITPQRVAEIRHASMEEIAAKLHALTMRLSHMLHMHSSRLNLLSSKLEDVIFEYGEMGMLLHVAADRRNLEIGVLKLETLQRQEPPEGHWEYVLESLQLRPEQEETLCAGFEQYLAKSAPVIAEMQELSRKMQQLTGAPLADVASAAAEDLPVGADIDDAGAGSGRDGGVKCGSGSDGGGGGQGEQQPCPPHSGSSARGTDGSIRNTSSTAAKGSSGADGGNCSSQAPAGAFSGSGQRITSCPLPASAQQQQRLLQQAEHDLQLGEKQQLAQHQLPEQQQPPLLQPELEQEKQQPQQQEGVGSFSGQWQTFETYQELEQTMKLLLNRVMKLRELHRTVTFLWLNTLDDRQNAISVVNSYPFWSRPLSMTSILAQSKGITANDSARAAPAAPAAHKAAAAPLKTAYSHLADNDGHKNCSGQVGAASESFERTAKLLPLLL